MNSRARLLVLVSQRSAFWLVLCSLSVYSTHGAAANLNAQHLYWGTGGNELVRSDLDGTGVVTLADPSSNFGGFVVDRRTASIYVTDSFRVRRFDLNGNNEQVLFTFPGLAHQGDIVLDHLRGHLYFSDARNNAIYRMRTDGSDVETIIAPSGTPSNATGIGYLNIDLVNNKLYWTDRQLTEPVQPTESVDFPDFPEPEPPTRSVDFRRSNLDGSDVEDLFSVSGSVGGFALDVSNEMIYWGQATGFAGGGSVHRATLDGQNLETLASGLWGPNSVVLDLPRDKMYFTDTWLAGPVDYDGTLRVANLDGREAQVLINFGSGVLDQPHALTLDPFLIPEPSGVLLMSIGILALGVLRRCGNASRNRKGVRKRLQNGS